jgi:hypothetical protein
MREQQKGYRPPVAETKMEEQEKQEEGVAVEISEVKEAKTLTIEDLDALLRESESVATVVSMSEKEIDEMVERRQESLDRLQNVEIIRESRLQRVENFNPLKDLKPSDYELLVQEGMVDAPYAERLKKLDGVIAKLESLDYPSADAKAELEKLSEVRNTFREKLESQIEERQQEIATWREEVKNKVLEHYSARVEELERTIVEIESNPRVMERLQTIAEKEMQAIFAKREAEKKAFEAKVEQDRKATIQEANRYIQSLSARHGNAFKRLGELLGNEKIANELVAVLSEEDARKQQGAFDRTRSRLMTTIIDGEGEKQLKDPKEIVPWKVAQASIQYREAIDFLRFHETKKALRAAADAGDKQAQKLLEQRDQIINGNEAIYKLVGPQWVMDRKTNERRMSAFWAAFETRKKNDKEGITATRKKEREEAAKREAAFKKATEEIVKRGGFVVEVPIIKEVRGKREVIGKEKGAVRLEKGKSKKGNEFWKVVETFGATNGLKVGDVSPLDMRSFPQWLRESAKPYFVMYGKDFNERLVYEAEE